MSLNGRRQWRRSACAGRGHADANFAVEAKDHTLANDGVFRVMSQPPREDRLQPRSADISKAFSARGAAAGIMTAAAVMGASCEAWADRIENQVAVFSALDKVTARISKFEVEINKTVTFSNIKVTPRVCFSRPSTELPKTTTFVEVDEQQLDGQQKRIFTGWMFAESPGIFGVEHPTIDVWLTECAKPLRTTAQKAAPAAGAKADDGSAAASDAQTADVPASDSSDEAPRRRVRR